MRLPEQAILHIVHLDPMYNELLSVITIINHYYKRTLQDAFISNKNEKSKQKTDTTVVSLHFYTYIGDLPTIYGHRTISNL